MGQNKFSILSFFLMTRRPLGSTLFPYTTLFRSAAENPRRLPHHRRYSPCGGLVGVEADRKSTRLNSSHVAISYAVFCLKKKRNVPTDCASAFRVQRFHKRRGWLPGNVRRYSCYA